MSDTENTAVPKCPEQLAGPYYYDQTGQFIVRKVEGFGDQRVLDVRAWGYLTGGGALAMPQEEAAKVQDQFAEWVIHCLNNMPKAEMTGDLEFTINAKTDQPFAMMEFMKDCLIKAPASISVGLMK